MLKFEDVFQIPEPCDKLASDVPSSRSSYCGSCEREIINLSALTRAEAMALIASDELHCASYWLDDEGEVIFADELMALAQEQPASLRAMSSALWRNAAVLTLPMLLAACEPEPPAPVADAVAPLTARAVAEVRPGAGRAPGAPLKCDVTDVACDPGIRLGVVQHKVQIVEQRYNNNIYETKRVTLKQSLENVELIQENRQAEVLQAQVRHSHRGRRMAGKRARPESTLIITTGGR